MLAIPQLPEIMRAARQIKPFVVRTPLVRLSSPDDREIYLKLENLQPVGSFKARCGANALLSRPYNSCVITASAGNFAQGLGRAGLMLGTKVTTIVPETAARSKLDALRAMDVVIKTTSYTDWWTIMDGKQTPEGGGPFIHPVADSAVLAGNATIGMEILEDCPGVRSVLAPFGGGGLGVGTAAALHMQDPTIKVYAAESEAGTPAAAAFAAGGPVPVDFNAATFITGMGGRKVLSSMWPLIKNQLAGSVCASLTQVATAIRLLAADHHIIAEGAGAVPLAAALANPSLESPIVCIVSGGHLDFDHLVTILQDRMDGLF